MPNATFTSPWSRLAPSPWTYWLERPGSPSGKPPVTIGPLIKDRVRDTTTSPGVNSAILTGVAATGCQTFFAAVGDNNSCPYAIQDQSGQNWEVGVGIYRHSGFVLERTTVLEGTNGPGVKVNFASGTQDVWVDDPAVLSSPANTNYNVKLFGAKGDVQTVPDGVMNAASGVLVSASGLFSASDVGKPISVKGPGVQGNNAGVANYLCTQVLSYQSPTQITLLVPATTAIASAEVYWGTDDATAINAATLAASINGGIVYFPPGRYFVGQAINWYTRTHLQGAGIDTTILMLKPGATCDIVKSNGFDSLTGGNTQGGINSCSIRDLSINGWLYHGGFLHTQVNASFNTADSTLTVLSTAGFPASGTLLVYDNTANRPGEAVSYAGTTATTFTGCTRALENTIPQPAVTTDSVDLRAIGGIYQSGCGIRVYGYGYVLDNVRVHDCEQDAIYSEWSTQTGAVGPDGIEAQIFNIKAHDCNGHGIWFQGPHDSIINTVEIFKNSLNGLRSGPGGSGGLQIIGAHSYGQQNWAFSLEVLTLLYNSEGEQGSAGQCYVNAIQCQIYGCRFFAAPSAIFTRGVVMGPSSTYCVIDCTIIDCLGGSIDFGTTGNNYYRLQIRQQGGGNVFISAPQTTSNLVVTETPGNFNALTGYNGQIAAPALFRSLQSGTPTLVAVAPFTQTANVFEFQGPTGVAVTVINKNGMLGIKQATPTFGLHQLGGSQRLVGLATPAAPTLTLFPTGGGTTYTYFIVAEDIAGFQTLVSASTATTTGPASLTATTWVRITWGAVTGAIKYYVLKTNNTTQLGTVSPNIGGVVTQVAVTNGGSGYTGAAPAIGFSGPGQNAPQATATVSGNTVTGITINTGAMGTGFTSVPTVVIGGPGSGATATANMGVSNISSVAAGGSGYVVNDTITLTGGTFATATVLKVTAVTAGAITAVAVQTVGSYSVLPSNPVSQGSTSGAGTAATFNLLWGIGSVTVTAGGTSYSSAPSIGFNGGGALPTCGVNLVANAVSGISVSGGTSAYTGTPTVVVQGVAAGSGCTATASIAALSLDDIGQGTSAFTNPLRNATADCTIDGNLTHTAASAIAVGTMGTTTTAVSSTTTAETKSLIGTIVGTFTCPANFLIVGRKLRFAGHGNITTGITASTIDFQIFFAGTKIASTGALAPTVSQANRYFEWDIEIECVTVGATGTLFCQGKVLMMNAAAPAAPILWPLLGNNATPPAAVTVDTTASSLMDFKTVTGNNLHTITLNPGTSLEVMN